MKNLSTAKNEWLALILIPFKIYVVGVIPFYFLWNLFSPQPLTIHFEPNTTELNKTASTLLNGFILCGVILSLGCCLQFFLGDSKRAVRTLFFAIVPDLILGFLCLIGVLQHLL